MPSSLILQQTRAGVKKRIFTFAWLEGAITPEAWLGPPSLSQRSDEVFDALWGCRVVYDPTGRLTALKQAIDATSTWR